MSVHNYKHLDALFSLEKLGMKTTARMREQWHKYGFGIELITI